MIIWFSHFRYEGKTKSNVTSPSLQSKAVSVLNSGKYGSLKLKPVCKLFITDSLSNHFIINLCIQPA